MPALKLQKAHRPQCQSRVGSPSLLLTAGIQTMVATVPNLIPSLPTQVFDFNIAYGNLQAQSQYFTSMPNTPASIQLNRVDEGGKVGNWLDVQNSPKQRKCDREKKPLKVDKWYQGRVFTCLC